MGNTPVPSCLLFWCYNYTALKRDEKCGYNFSCKTWKEKTTSKTEAYMGG
jgi:hypothetical protein